MLTINDLIDKAKRILALFEIISSQLLLTKELRKPE